VDQDWTRTSSTGKKWEIEYAKAECKNVRWAAGWADAPDTGVLIGFRPSELAMRLVS
jgi:hypothetical protein